MVLLGGTEWARIKDEEIAESESLHFWYLIIGFNQKEPVLLPLFTSMNNALTETHPRLYSDHCIFLGCWSWHRVHCVSVIKLTKKGEAQFVLYCEDWEYATWWYLLSDLRAKEALVYRQASTYICRSLWICHVWSVQTAIHTVVLLKLLDLLTFCSYSQGNILIVDWQESFSLWWGQM